jgi:hypothetical protein
MGLKGPNSVAQGNALGKKSSKDIRLEGASELDLGGRCYGASKAKKNPIK